MLLVLAMGALTLVSLQHRRVSALSRIEKFDKAEDDFVFIRYCL